MSDTGRILVVDDDASICEVLSIMLKHAGHFVVSQTNPVEAVEVFRKEDFDVVIQDIRMPQMNGIDLLKKLKEIRPEVPVVIITAYSTWDTAVEALRIGAYDYIRKPFDVQHDIKATVRRALQVKERASQVMNNADRILEKLGFVIGYSRQMKQVWDLVRKASQTDSTCLIQGESGTGKELIARALHYLSARSAKSFVAINCGAIPENLLESELFGHVKGAFTDAASDKTGLVDLAGGGTLFLDEVSEMRPALQVKILRVLEEQEYRPVGSPQTRKADVRFVTATNRDLQMEVEKGTFRRDLYFRLNVIPILLPPLRERKEDIPILSEYFLHKYARQMRRNLKGFSEQAKSELETYDWPGNVREVENLVQRAVALAEGEVVDVGDLFGAIRPTPTPTAPANDLIAQGVSLDEKVRDLEIHYLKRALELTEGNHTKASQLLKMSLSSFRYKIQKYGLEKGG